MRTPPGGRRAPAPKGPRSRATSAQPRDADPATPTRAPRPRPPRSRSASGPRDPGARPRDPGPTATWGSTLVADMLHEQPARCGAGAPAGSGLPARPGLSPALSRPRARRLLPGRRAAAPVAGRAGRSRAGAGRDALTRRRLQWRQRRRRQLQRRRQQRRLRWRRRQRGRGCATSANAGQAGRSTSRHAPRLRVAARRDGSHTRVPVSRGRAGRAWAVTWACPVAPRGPPSRCASVGPRASRRSGGDDAAAAWRAGADWCRL